MTWRNPRWGSLTGPDADVLRSIFEDLSTWLRRPTFGDGIQLGNGASPTYDPVTDVTVPPPTVDITSDNAASPPSTDATAPEAPTSVVFTSSFRSATVSWSPPSDADMQNGHGSYEVQLADSNDFLAPIITTSNGTHAVFDGLTTGLTYWARVRAIDPSGNVGAWSASASGTTASVETADVADLTIVRAKIADLAVDNAKIADLTAGKLTSGTINAQTIQLGATGSAAAIQSTNYSTGSAGWKVDGNGNAEFNDVTVRGTLETGTSGARVAVPDGQSRIDFYSGNPQETAPGSIEVTATAFAYESPTITGAVGSRFSIYSNDPTWGSQAIIASPTFRAQTQETVLGSSSGNSAVTIQGGDTLATPATTQLLFKSYSTTDGTNVTRGGWSANGTNLESVNGKPIKVGTATMGQSAHGTSFAAFGHNDIALLSNQYALLQNSTGETFVNSKTGQFLRFRTNNADCLTIRQSGGTEIILTGVPSLAGATLVRNATSGQIGPTSSSARNKTAIGDIPMERAGGNNPLLQLRPRQFYWNDDVLSRSAPDAALPQVGLLAEEVAQIMPNAVWRDADGHAVALNEPVLIGHLIEAVQHLAARVAALEVGRAPQ